MKLFFAFMVITFSLFCAISAHGETAIISVEPNDQERAAPPIIIEPGTQLSMSAVNVPEKASKPAYLKSPYRELTDSEWSVVSLFRTTKGKCIFVDYACDTDKGEKQHFVAYEGEKRVRTGLTSGAATDIDVSKDHHPKDPHNHLGFFWVTSKEEYYWSKSHSCPMRWCLFYWNGHGHAIHATTKDLEKLLGQPASGGCVRLSRIDAEWLFKWAGKDPVAVIIYRSK